ncbi:MAG: bifunctional riboflavin kinase/FAD synthetase [Selenomonadales bacterium]|nr:bifunctional riboflavin kinase/FAD synthetase [Selenomonadales bacterium]
MELCTELSQLKDKYANICIALGTFDGVHRGHQQVIGAAVARAREIGGTSLVFTFSNHPLSVVAPERCPVRLMSNEEKQIVMRDLGVDVLVNIPFTKEVLSIGAEDFIRMLIEAYEPKFVVVGPNYTFGYKNQGNSELLKEFGKKYGFEVKIHEAVCDTDDLISSTLIRGYINDGNVEKTADLLGRDFRLTSTVVHGDERGRTIGFPTANLDLPPEAAVPNNGVYAVRAITADGVTHSAVANIGTNPTFDGIYRHIEVHILDFAADIYGQELTIEFLAKLRNEQKFSGIEALVNQLHQDVETAKKYF